MKRVFAIFLVIIMCLSTFTFTASAATPPIKVIVNGQAVKFDQPPIDYYGAVLVSIRPVCDKIGATFSWDAKTKTTIVKKDTITLKWKVSDTQMSVEDKSTNYKGTEYLDYSVQMHNGVAYVAMRTVLMQLGYDYAYNTKNKTVTVTKSNGVYLHGQYYTEVNSISNWACVSPVQQFVYKNDGIAYAYVSGKNLIITLPSKKLLIPMKYPSLGDVTSDSDGNFYVVSGKEGTAPTDKTVFISKYSPDGTEIKTTGFVGQSIMGDTGNTQRPFDAGNCMSAIANGKLMVNYARGMYTGHQSDNVIGVNISDMSPITWDSVWDIPYTSHSFNQSVIWSQLANDFIYADQGDAYDRGFIITKGTKANANNIFHFYLQANANYDMYIVNQTFAQMGGLAETSKGIVFVGASAKSISKKAKSEKQNLFVQIFDPTLTQFIGGVNRTGALATDINDKKNSPLTSVTDYGVQWLTNYTDTDAVAPQVIVANDKICILWTTSSNTFYTVLDASGKTLTPPTSLNHAPLNSYETPLYFNGAVYWAGITDNKLIIESIKCVK